MPVTLPCGVVLPAKSACFRPSTAAGTRGAIQSHESTIAKPMPATIKDTEIEAIASGLKSVAHPLRLGMLCLLADGELSVGDICDALGTSQPNISHHLSLLANRRLLTARKDANRVLYALANRRMVPAIELLRQVYCP